MTGGRPAGPVLRPEPLPDTSAIRAARTVAERYLTPALVSHSVRVWHWAVGLAAVLDLRPQRELLAVAVLLHDIGLAEPFDAVQTPYEIAGGHVAAVFAAGAGWPASQQERLLQVIERHNWFEVDPALDVEGHLLELAAGLDILGSHVDLLPPEFLSAVSAKYPRGDLDHDFGGRVVDQAHRKPTSQAARIVADGLVERLARNPLRDAEQA